MKLTADQKLADTLASFYADPLGYVMFCFPWDEDPSIQMVELQEPWRSKYGCKYGPDKWACQFLERLGQEVASRKFDGQNAVPPIRFSTASGHGIGKSVMVAWLIKWIMDTRDMCKGVVTANTADQLKTKTWAELAKWHSISLTAHLCVYTNSRGNMSFYRKGWGTAENKKKIEDNWKVTAQTCREENSEAFAGQHAVNSTSFYIFDEASAVPDAIFDVREGGLTDGEPMVFDFGNPTRKSGRFFENTVGMYSHRYITRRIDSRDVQITNKGQLAEWEQDWGKDSDFFKVRVKGEFPSAGSVQFINSDAVRAAMTRPVPPDEVTRAAPLLVGVDVARFGDNQTVIYPRMGMDARTLPYRTYRGLTIPQTVERVVEALQEYQRLGRKCQGLFVDGGGLGAGVVDMLRALGWNVIEVQGGRAATDPHYRFYGHEIWGRMRDAMEKIALPLDDDLQRQLTQREYGFVGDSHKIMLETKRDMEKRGVVSPDVADALALTFGPAPMEEVYSMEGMGWSNRQLAAHEYDPLENM